MKKIDKLSVIKKAKDENLLCRMYFKYDTNYFYYLPVAFNEKFFYGIEEDDFIADGFSIRRISDLSKVEARDDKCNEFLVKEKTFENINAPLINLDSWKTIFEALQKTEKYIIVEKESLDDDESEFTIGKIMKINNTSLWMKDFDAEGEWDETIIPYRSITSVTFQSRYVLVWAKYLD